MSVKLLKTFKRKSVKNRDFFYSGPLQFTMEYFIITATAVSHKAE